MKTPRKLSAPQIASIVASVMMAVLFLSFLISSGLLRDRSTGIVLPDKDWNTPVVSSGSQLLTVQSVAEVDIGLDNAQHIIKTLVRPDAYSCSIENTLYYTGGESTLSCRQYVLGDTVRTDMLNTHGTVQSTTLRVRDSVYAWRTGESKAYEGSWGDFSVDAAAMLPTYEDVLQAEIVLTDAGKQDLEGEPCIFAAFEKDGYRCVYYVSAVNGLLKSASFYSGDVLTRCVTVKEIQTESPDEALFVLPGNESVLGE